MEVYIALALGKISAVLGLVAANGFFVAAEFSLVGVRQSRVEELVAQGHGGAKLLLRALDELDDSLAATQLGVTVSSLGLGWIGETALARLIEPALAVLGTFAAASAHVVAISIAFAVITVFHIVLGELVPKSVALLRPERTGLLIVRPLRLFLTLFRPAVFVLNGLGNVVSQLFGVERGQGEGRLHSTEELKLLIAASKDAGIVEKGQQEVVERAFAMGERRVRAIMTPRHDVHWVDADGTIETILRGVRRGRHEQIVIARGSLDNVVGTLRKQDLLDMHLDGKLPGPGSDEGSASLLMAVRAPLVIHDAATVMQVLETFKSRLVQIAFIYDEYGAFRGLVTQSDLLEALAGEILDHEDEKAVVRRQDGSFLANAAQSFEDIFAQVGIRVSHDERSEYRTLAGFVLSRLERIPVTGDAFELEVAGDTWSFHVSSMEGHRIDEVTIRKVASTEQVSPQESDPPQA